MQVFDRKNATPRPFSRRNASAGRLTEGRFRGGRPSTIWWSATEELVECHQIVGGVPPAHRCSGTPGGGGQKARLTGIFSENDGGMAQNWQKVFAGMKIMSYICRKKKP